MPSRRIGQGLRDDLLAAERDDDHGADVGMTTVHSERVVGDAHVRPELPAPGQVRKRRANRLGRGHNALGHH